MRPSGLLNLEGAQNLDQLVQENFEILNESLAFQRQPSKRNGVAVTTAGHPLNGTWNQNQYWVDAHRSLWVCTAYGTPGTWRQLDAALMSSFPSAVPDKYRVIRTDQNFKEYYWDFGTSTWKEIFLSITGGTLTGPLILHGDPVDPLGAATKQFVEALNVSDAEYSFRQMTPSAVWPTPGATPSNHIEHNLGKRPSVTIVDEDQNVFIGDVQYINDNEVVITFSEPLSGWAYFS